MYRRRTKVFFVAVLLIGLSTEVIHAVGVATNQALIEYIIQQQARKKSKPVARKDPKGSDDRADEEGADTDSAIRTALEKLYHKATSCWRKNR